MSNRLILLVLCCLVVVCFTAGFLAGSSVFYKDTTLQIISFIMVTASFVLTATSIAYAKRNEVWASRES